MLNSYHQKLIAIFVLSIVVSIAWTTTQTTVTPSNAQVVLQNPERQVELIEVVSFPDKVPVGVAVSDRGRVFVTLPYSNYSTGPHPASVVEVFADGTTQPYPNEAWNQDPSLDTEAPSDRFLNVQSNTIDSDGFLWLLDTGNPKRAGVVSGGAKLVKVDLTDNQVVQVVTFPDSIVPSGSFLNDVRVDVQHQFAYLSETGEVGGLIVINLQTGDSRKIPSVDLPTRTEQGEGPTRVQGGWGFPDGIVLDENAEYLYFHATSGSTLFRVPTAILRDFGLPSAEVGRNSESVATTVRTDGMYMDEEGYIYHSDFTRHAVSRYRLGGEIEIVVQDQQIIFPDAIAVGPDRYVYFSDPQFPRLAPFNNGVDESIRPFKVYKALLPS